MNIHLHIPLPHISLLVWSVIGFVVGMLFWLWGRTFNGKGAEAVAPGLLLFGLSAICYLTSAALLLFHLGVLSRS